MKGKRENLRKRIDPCFVSEPTRHYLVEVFTGWLDEANAGLLCVRSAMSL